MTALTEYLQGRQNVPLSSNKYLGLQPASCLLPVVCTLVPEKMLPSGIELAAALSTGVMVMGCSPARGKPPSTPVL
jgi:hypothetical protein